MHGGVHINKFIIKIKNFGSVFIKNFKEIEKKITNKIKAKYVKKNRKEFTIPMKMHKNIYAKMVIWSIIIFTISSGILAFLRVRTLNVSISKQSKEITGIIEELEKVRNKNVYSPKLSNFINDFVNLYVNIPNDLDQFSIRHDTLKKYFSNENILFLDTPTENIHRELRNTRLMDLRRSEELITAEVKVEYTLIKDQIIIGNEYTEVEEYEQAMILKLIMKEEDDRLFIVSTPQFIGISSEEVATSTLAFEDIYGSKSQVKNEKAQKINEFLDEFFQKYATGSKEDMKYMMHDPITLNGNFEFKETTNKIYEDKSGFIALSTVVFEQYGIRQTEVMTLHISEENNKFFVKELYMKKGGE